MSEETQTKPDVKSLLQMQAELALAKTQAIDGLLTERVTLQASTETRLKEIAEELKALGWHRERVRISTVTNPEPTGDTPKEPAPESQPAVEEPKAEDPKPTPRKRASA